MDTISPPWNICVVTWELETPEHSSLSNALLYGTEVIWIPARLPVIVCTVETFISRICPMSSASHGS